jgi:putative FmdB family regulatory protein
LKIFAECPMPIYAYRCDACGFSKDVLQKISDPVLSICLSCGAPAFKKQVTAAGFQLKGSGWYVTDFRGGKTPPTAVAPATGGAAAGADKAGAASADAGTPGSSAAAAAGGTPAAGAAAPSAPAGTAPKSDTNAS